MSGAPRRAPSLLLPFLIFLFILYSFFVNLFLPFELQQGALTVRKVRLGLSPSLRSDRIIHLLTTRINSSCLSFSFPEFIFSAFSNASYVSFPFLVFLRSPIRLHIHLFVQPPDNILGRHAVVRSVLFYVYFYLVRGDRTPDQRNIYFLC